MELRAQLAELRTHGWRVDLPSAGVLTLPIGFLARYDGLPDELLDFLGGFDVCANPTNDSWLVSGRDLSAPEAFRYNEFERMSLEAAQGDSEWAESIRAFWTNHFPVLISVAGSYQYFALALDGPNKGAVVYGAEPEFESISGVAPSLAEFVSQLVLAVRSEAPPFPFSQVLSRRLQL